MRLVAVEFDSNGNPTSLQELGDGTAVTLNLPQYTDDAEAVNNGLSSGDWYQDGNGVVRIVQ